MNGVKTIFFYLVILGLFITLFTPVVRADYMDPAFCRVYNKTPTYYQVECSIDVFSNGGSLLYIFSYANMSWNSVNISMIKSIYYNNYAVLLTFYNETDNTGSPISVVISSLQNTVYGDYNVSRWNLNITWGYYNGSELITVDSYFDLTPTGGYFVAMKQS